MKKQQLIIFIAAIFILAAGFYGYRFYKGVKPALLPAPDEINYKVIYEG